MFNRHGALSVQNDLADQAGVILCEVESAIRKACDAARAAGVGRNIVLAKHSAISGHVTDFVGKIFCAPEMTVRSHSYSTQRSVGCRKFIFAKDVTTCETTKRIGAGFHKPDRAVRMSDHGAWLRVGAWN